MKKILITGSASGIGLYAAQQLTELGFDVIGIDHQAGEYVTYQINITHEDEIERILSEEKPDILVHCAGIYVGGEFTDQNIDIIKNILDVNLLGTIILNQSFIRSCLREKKHGRIINIASSLGLNPEPFSSVYCASKAAVIHLTKSLALSYADRNITVNAVCPGPIDTPLLKNTFPNKDTLDSYLKAVPVGRIGKTAEVFNMIKYLLTSSSFSTGGIYTVDGGESIASANFLNQKD